MTNERTYMKPERENNYQKAFGKRLIVERQKRNWSQSDLAEKIGDGTVLNTVSRWENGKNFPSPYCRKRLCEVLDLSPNELFREFLEAIVKGTEIGTIGTPEDQNK